MKSVCCAIALILISTASLAQAVADSLSHKAKSLQNESGELLDSLNSLASLSHIRDSLTIHAWSDSLRNKISHRFSTDFFNRYSDSLRAVGMPEPAITRRVDSLLQGKTSLLREVEENQNKLQRKVTDRYTTWTEGLRKKLNLDSAGVSLPGANLPANRPNLPGTSPSVPAVTGIPDIPPVPSLGAEDFSSLGISSDLSQIGGPLTLPSAPQLGEWQRSMPTLPDLAGEASKYSNELKQLTSNPSDAAEKALGNVSEVSDATRALSEAEQLKKQNEALKVAEQLEDPAVTTEAVKQEAVNHFVGKEAEVQGAMSQMAKYKKKYSSLGSLSEIKKNDWLPHNGLKGNPFKERFRVGMNLGYKGSGDTLIFDFHPNTSYRITGRLEAGLGAIYRLRVTTGPFSFDQRNPVWGISSFVMLKTFKSVFLRCELDGNSFPISGSADRAPYRDWRWSFYTGIQTNFKLGKRWTGNVQMLYNFGSNLKDGFPEKLAARVGVQYSLK